MPLGNAETIGLAEQHVQFLQDNKTTLSESGLDVSVWITKVGALKTDAVTQIGKQDDAQAAAKVQTKVTQTSVKTLYETVSTQIDAASGVLGKNTPAAKQLKSLRSSLIKQSKPKKAKEDKS